MPHTPRTPIQKSSPSRSAAASPQAESARAEVSEMVAGGAPLSPQQMLRLQRTIGNRRTMQLYGQLAQAAPTPWMHRRPLPARATIQRNPLAAAVSPYLTRVAEIARKGGPKLLHALEMAADAPGALKNKITDAYETRQAEAKLEEKAKARTNKRDKGKIRKALNYTFGADFTFENKLDDEVDEMPSDMAAKHIQLESIAQMIANVNQRYLETKGTERKNNAETLAALRERQKTLHHELSQLMMTYGQQQQAAVQQMQVTVIQGMPQDVKDAAAAHGLELNKVSDYEALLELYESMHPIAFREAELSARQAAFASVHPYFVPMRHTAEGQLLSDVKKAFVQDSLDEARMTREKQEKKERKREDKVEAKIHLGERALKGEVITSDEKKQADKGQKTDAKPTPPAPQQTGTPWTASSGSVGVKVGNLLPGTPALKLASHRKQEKQPEIVATDKINEDASTASSALRKGAKGLKIGSRGLKTIVTQATGGTQDDEGVLRAAPPVLTLGAELADMAGSIQLITEGNSAQKKLGKKQLKDNVFGVFNAISQGVRRSLNSAEQFQIAEASEGVQSTPLTELGVPIVGAIMEGVKLVKSTLDAAMQGKRSLKFGDLKQEATAQGGQTGALSDAFEHGRQRDGELMGRSIASGVISGLALVGHILTATGVGAVVGESIKICTRVIRLAQKVGEKVRDSYRTGKELEARYKARLGLRGSEEGVMALSGKYASTALLRRALDGDAAAIKGVKAHGIDEKMLDDIRAGRVFFSQARALMMHDWKEKEDPKTIGMQVMDKLGKAKEKLGSILGDSDKEQPQPQNDIAHLGRQPFPQNLQQPQEDYDNPVNYQPPQPNQGIWDKVKSTVKDTAEHLKPQNAWAAAKGGVVKGAKEIDKAVHKTFDHTLKLTAVKWEFIKSVKDTVQYGGETRGANWTLNRILSKDSDVDEQFDLVVKLLARENLFQQKPEEHQQLVQRLAEILDKEEQIKQKYDIKFKPEKVKPDTYMY